MMSIEPGMIFAGKLWRFGLISYDLLLIVTNSAREKCWNVAPELLSTVLYIDIPLSSWTALGLSGWHLQTWSALAIYIPSIAFCVAHRLWRPTKVLADFLMFLCVLLKLSSLSWWAAWSSCCPNTDHFCHYVEVIVDSFSIVFKALILEDLVFVLSVPFVVTMSVVD